MFVILFWIQSEWGVDKLTLSVIPIPISRRWQVWVWPRGTDLSNVKSQTPHKVSYCCGTSVRTRRPSSAKVWQSLAFSETNPLNLSPNVIAQWIMSQLVAVLVMQYPPAIGIKTLKLLRKHCRNMVGPASRLLLEMAGFITLCEPPLQFHGALHSSSLSPTNRPAFGLCNACDDLVLRDQFGSALWTYKKTHCLISSLHFLQCHHFEERSDKHKMQGDPYLLTRSHRLALDTETTRRVPRVWPQVRWVIVRHWSCAIEEGSITERSPWWYPGLNSLSRSALQAGWSLSSNLLLFLFSDINLWNCWHPLWDGTFVRAQEELEIQLLSYWNKCAVRKMRDDLWCTTLLSQLLVTRSQMQVWLSWYFAEDNIKSNGIVQKILKDSTSRDFK